LSAALDHSFEKYAIGQSVSRAEDPRLLQGHGTFTDDINVAGQAYAYVFRSPYAHARILRLNVETARAAPGVLAVLTAADLQDAGIATLPCALPMKNRDGSPMIKPPRPALSTDRVRYMGEAVALVVAETLAQARDASELIDFEVEELASVTDCVAAAEDGAPLLHDEAPRNTCLDWEYGDGAAVDAAFAEAHHITRLRLRSNRVHVSAMEPRSAVAEFDAQSSRYTLHAPSQGVFGLTGGLANIMGVEREQMHVLTNDVGGSFGMKGAPYPEYPPLLLAARRLGRPVKWCDDRSGSMVSDQHGRDSWAEASLAFDKEGRILAGRVEVQCNVGAYLTGVGPSMHTRNVPRNFPGVYRVTKFHAHTRARFTNTTPIGAYRGAGRPEGAYYMERMMDTAARELGIDRVEIRRRNMITPSEIPFAAVSELTYDSGDFPAVFEAGIQAADWDGFEARRTDSAARGKIRGLGLAAYLEVTGPPATEMGGLRFEDDGSVTMITGSLNYGQGHHSTFAQIVCSTLGVPFERLALIQGDSDELIAGAGTGGSRTVISSGTALLHASERVIENGRKLSAHVLEAAETDIEFEHGTFTIAGTDRSIDIMSLADEVRNLKAKGALPEDLPQGLDVQLKEDTPPSAFPNGCHVAEIEIEPETGEVEVVRYTVVDDFGTLINPMLVEGQVHGGVVQGMGQALMENTVYDGSGQLIAGSYMDYAMPRADNIPHFDFDSHPVPAKTNPLGAKGCGEAGTTGSLPAVMNAIVDALHREKGIAHIDMPATSERIWRALNGD
jgi:carbon-monoxide dehydrogenase large subunit